MKCLKQNLFIIGILAASLPAVTCAQSNLGPSTGEREFSLSGTGTSDKDLDNSSFGLSGDFGWYLSDRTSWGIRQSISYADIEGADASEDFWNGSTRGYLDYHFGTNAARPFVGASLGGVYGDGVNDSAFAGLELGLKYYVLDSTYIMARAEYQFFFESGLEADDNFNDGAWAYTLGMGFNF